MIHADRPTSRFLSRKECQELAYRAARLSVGGGVTQIMLTSNWTGNVRWARNQISLSSDVRDNTVVVSRTIRGAQGSVTINQIDDVSLVAALRRAEREVALQRQRIESVFEDRSAEPHLDPPIWSEATYTLDMAARAQAVRAMVQPAIDGGVVSAGYLEVAAHGQASIDSIGNMLYYPYTVAQCSLTTRDDAAQASGWAGVDFNDWGRIDTTHLAEVSLEKCLRSRNPVAIEPARYATVLEPQAVADVIGMLVNNTLDRGAAEGVPGYGPFARHNGTSRIGEQILDPRVTIGADPMDPDAGFPPFATWSFTDIYHPVTWIDKGVLKQLAYSRPYGVQRLGRKIGLPNSGAFRMQGGDSSVEDMIATTPRGVLVTRFAGVQLVDSNAVMLTGYTRDGFWLIENGVVGRPLKNMRFMESPLFAFNKLEALGPAQRVFRPDSPAVAPPAKVRDFNFVSLIDAF